MNGRVPQTWCARGVWQPPGVRLRSRAPALGVLTAIGLLFLALSGLPVQAQAVEVRATQFRESGLAKMGSGDHFGAIEDFSRALSLTPYDAVSLANRGECHRVLGSPGPAIADFTRSLELNPGVQWVYASRGESYRAQGQYYQALADLDTALARDPGHSFSYASRGDTYRLMEVFDAAIADFSRAIELSPDYQWALTRRGEALRMNGQLDRALADLNRALQLNPQDSFSFATRGQIYRQKGEYDAGLADLDTAIALDPNYAWAIERRGELVAEMTSAGARGTVTPLTPPTVLFPVTPDPLLLPLVAVLDFRIENLPAADGALIQDVLTSALVQTRRFRVLDRGRMEAMMAEIEFSHSDMVDKERQLEIGRMLSADQILSGSLGRVGQRYVISATLLDVRTGETLSSAHRIHAALEEVVDGCADLAASLSQ